MTFFGKIGDIKILPTYRIYVKIYILKKIKIKEKTLKKGDLENKKSLKKLYDKFKREDVNNIYSIKKIQLKDIKNIVRLMDFNLSIKIDTENAALTAILVGMLDGIVPNLLNYFFELNKRINFSITPIYQNKNQITLYFDGIFEFDLIHIINIYKVLMVKERKGVKNGTSNRKSYAYNNG